MAGLRCILERHQLDVCTNAAVMNGNTRVGLGDWLSAGSRKARASNADQIAKIRRIIEEPGFQVATSAEARLMLG